MSSSSTSSSSGGLGFAGALTILFVALKLTGVITWSWWWVISPIWISGLFALAIIAIGFLILLIFASRDTKKRRTNL